MVTVPAYENIMFHCNHTNIRIYFIFTTGITEISWDISINSYFYLIYETENVLRKYKICYTKGMKKMSFLVKFKLYFLLSKLTNGPSCL